MGRGGPSGYRLLAWRGGARFHVPAGLVGGFCLTTTRVPDRTHATIRDIVGHVTGSITGFITGCLTETIAPPAAPPRTRSRVPHDVVGTLSGIRCGHQR